MCKGGGTPDHTLCQCPALAKHKLKIFSFARLELIDTWRASIKLVLALAVQSRFFEGPQHDQEHIMDPTVWDD
jgi:hypothetical protein